MNDCKNELVNVILYSMIDKLDKEQVDQLKHCLQVSFYSYDINKIENTELSCGCGNTTQELIDYYAICKLGSGRSQDTVKQYIRVVHQLCDMVHKELNMITSDDVIFFLARYPYTKTPVVSKCTMDSKRRYLSSVFSLLKKHKKIAENPMDMVEQIKYMSKAKIPLDKKEINNIRAAILREKNEMVKTRNSAILEMFLDTGLRVSELSGINLSDINFNNKEIKVIGKNNKERIVMFSKSTKDKISEYLKYRSIDIHDCWSFCDIPLFMNKSNTIRLKASGIQNLMKKLRKPSGILRLHPHLLRASSATHMATQGIPIDVVAEYLGHSGLGVIQKYVINSRQRMKTELQKVGIGYI
jgi:integrase/recombinase XerD